MADVKIPALASARLLLHPLALSDCGAIQASFPRWDIVKFLSLNVPWPYPPDGALSFLREIALPGTVQGREWHWSIRPKTVPDQLIGIISLRDTEDDNRGFWLDPAWWGQGLMTEAADTVTAFWFDVLKRPVLRVPKAAANLPSRRISERAGMRVVAREERDYVSGRHLAEIWEITAEEWRRAQPPAS